MRTDMLNLLKSVSPFMQERGKNMISLTIQLNDLISSQAARDSLRLFSAVQAPRIMDAGENADAQGLEETNSFGLFLILLLLIMAAGNAKAQELDVLDGRP